MSDDIKDTTMLSENGTAAKEVFEAKPVETPDASKVVPVADSAKGDKRVPLAELQKERQRRRQAEEEGSRLRHEFDELKANVSRFTKSKDEDALVDKAEKELGIDKEQARKLINLQKEVAETVSPKQPNQYQTNAVSDPVLRAMDDFKKRASEVANDYEDWNDMIPSMQAIMARQIELDGHGAYMKSPEYYYSKAIKAQKESESQMKREAAVDRSNNSSLAESETGGGSVKRNQGSKINQTIWDANRSDPKWVNEHIDEIKVLWKEGKIK